MRNARDILGLPVIEIESGKQLGTVEDMMIDNHWTVQGIVLETKHWFSSPHYVAWDDAISIGEDAVTIPNEQVLQKMEQTTEMFFLMSGSNKIKGLPIFTVNGHELGNVEDVYFGDNKGNKIVGYELSDGFISDLQEGRKRLRLPDRVTMGKDTIIVPVHCDRELEEIITPNKE